MPKTIHWTKDALAQLGIVPDAEIAKRLRISIGSVRKKRGELKSKLRNDRRRTKSHKWGQVELGLLCYPDAEVARLTGRKIAEIKAKRAERR